MNEVTNLPLFDYAQLEPKARAVAQEAAGIIRLHGKRAAESIFEIGRQLLRVRKAFEERGEEVFLAWLDHEFRWKKSSAYNFMNVADRLPDDFQRLEVDAGALYLLSTKAAEPARDAALAMAREGKRVTHATVKDIIEGVRKQAAETFKPPADASPPAERPGPDPVRVANFETSAALNGRFRDFRGLVSRPPAEVALTIDPILRRGQSELAYTLARWLDELVAELEKLDDQAA
jgi:hypothetical protein